MDTPASVVFQATNLLRAASAAKKADVPFNERRWKDISHLSVKDLEEEKTWQEAVSRETWKKYLGLLCYTGGIFSSSPHFKIYLFSAFYFRHMQVDILHLFSASSICILHGQHTHALTKLRGILSIVSMNKLHALCNWCFRLLSSSWAN